MPDDTSVGCALIMRLMKYWAQGTRRLFWVAPPAEGMVIVKGVFGYHRNPRVVEAPRSVTTGYIASNRPKVLVSIWPLSKFKTVPGLKSDYGDYFFLKSETQSHRNATFRVKCAISFDDTKS